MFYFSNADNGLQFWLLWSGLPKLDIAFMELFPQRRLSNTWPTSQLVEGCSSSVDVAKVNLPSSEFIAVHEEINLDGEEEKSKPTKELRKRNKQQLK